MQQRSANIQHKHKESDITDLTPYLPLAGGTVTGELITNSTFRLEAAGPALVWEETDADADEKIWRVRATAGQFQMNTRPDDESDSTAFLNVSRTGTAVDEFDLRNCDTIRFMDGPRFRIQDTTDVDYAEFYHDGTDFNTTLVGANAWKIAGATKIQLDDVYVQYQTTGARSAGLNAVDLADDAEYTFSHPGSGTGGLMFVFQVNGVAETDFWIGFVGGGNLTTIAEGSNVVSAGNNPDTDGKLNVFATAGDLIIKNRRGSERTYVAYIFGS